LLEPNKPSVNPHNPTSPNILTPGRQRSMLDARAQPTLDYGRNPCNVSDCNEDAALTLEGILFERQRAVGGVVYWQSRHDSNELEDGRHSRDTDRDSICASSPDHWASQRNEKDSQQLIGLFLGRTDLIWQLFVTLMPSERQGKHCVHIVSLLGSSGLFMENRLNDKFVTKADWLHRCRWKETTHEELKLTS
jgi:hypothetical protein